MFEFLQTPDGLIFTAKVVPIVIAFAFLLSVHPFKKKKRLVIADLATGPYNLKEEDPSMLTAGDYFTLLSSMIRSAPTLEKLNAYMPAIEAFFDRKYRVTISNQQLQKYYARLLEVYCAREQELEHIAVVMCKN